MRTEILKAELYTPSSAHTHHRPPSVLNSVAAPPLSWVLAREPLGQSWAPPRLILTLSVPKSVRPPPKSLTSALSLRPPHRPGPAATRSRLVLHHGLLMLWLPFSSPQFCSSTGRPRRFLGSNVMLFFKDLVSFRNYYSVFRQGLAVWFSFPKESPPLLEVCSVIFLSDVVRCAGFSPKCYPVGQGSEIGYAEAGYPGFRCDLLLLCV